MNKNTSANNSPEIVQPSSATSEIAQIALAPFWLLNAGTAKKLGQRSAGKGHGRRMRQEQASMERRHKGRYDHFTVQAEFLDDGVTK